MKKLYLLPFLVLLSSCTNNETTISKDKSNVKIIIEDSEYFKTEKSIYKIKKGENLSLYLDYKDGYTINSLNYSNSSIQRDDLGNAFVILNDIQYDTRIKVQSSEIGYVFVYHLNGGEYITPEKENKKDYFVSFEKNERHLYPNTSLGINRIQRQNFLLTGWNTKEDLTGDLISLGSRIDLKESKKIDLYANWIKETDCSKFTYTKEKDNTITIDSYIGKDGVDIVIPEKIGGYEVKTISSDFLWFYKCDNLIISRNIRNINEKAFYKCEFKNVVIYDTLKNVDDSSFLNSNIENIRINANSNPRFQSGNNNAEFVEKLDRLYSLKGKKKIVLFGGCSLSYGLKSELLKDAFPSYEIVNMGVIGGVNASMQLDCIIPFLETGDIFIHTPEEMSDFQHLNNFDMDSRSFILFEGNYDYLKYINFSNCNKFFSAFHEYVDIREYFPSQNYTDYNSNYNYYGDICITRPLNDDNSIFNLENCFDNKSLKSFNTLNEYYKKIQEKGVTNYFSFAPLNLNAYNKNKNDNDIYKNEYVELLSSKLKFTTIISNIDDYIIEGKYFYDEDYHLNDEGAIKRTKKLIEDLNSVERK